MHQFLPGFLPSDAGEAEAAEGQGSAGPRGTASRLGSAPPAPAQPNHTACPCTATPSKVSQTQGCTCRWLLVPRLSGGCLPPSGELCALLKQAEHSLWDKSQRFTGEHAKVWHQLGASWQCYSCLQCRVRHFLPHWGQQQTFSSRREELGEIPLLNSSLLQRPKALAPTALSTSGGAVRVLPGLTAVKTQKVSREGREDPTKAKRA